MKQNQLLALLTTFSLTVGVILNLSGYPLKFNYFSNLEEGCHPKKVNIAITCPDDLTLYVNNDCIVEAIIPTPYSSCNIISLSYSVDGGSLVSLTIGTSGFPTIINLGFLSLDTINIAWSVTDDCGTNMSCNQVLKILDSIIPTINCPLPTTVSLNGECKFEIPNLIPLTVSFDNCTKTVTQSPIAGSLSINSPATITMTVTDQGGNSTLCTTTVTAIDLLGPDIVCKDTLKISITEYPEIPAWKFVTSASDNCGGDLSYQARRMGNICGDTIPDDFGNYINLCCDDVKDTITIVVRVYDQNNNFTECMTRLIVQDKLAPIIKTPIPDISISCEYPINLNNLDIFGTFVSQDSTQNQIVVNDPVQPPFYPSGIAGMDGVYLENCPIANVSVSTRNLLTMCNTGELKRDFVIRDSSNNFVTFTQTIYIIDVNKFSLSDITWPNAIVDYFNCNDNDPDIALTGAPILNSDNCNLVAATYVDQTFSYPLHCKYIRRNWTVVDWCQYKSNTTSSPGKWTFIQNIYIKNNIAPTISNSTCKDTMICTQNANCSASVTFNASGTDDCLPINIKWSYKIDLNNNGGSPDLTGIGSSITSEFEIGTHRLTWEAKDGCNNISTCSFLFTVKDCKAPNVVVLKGLATNLMLPDGIATIWAKDFNNFSSDDCSPSSKLKYSFSPDTTNTNRTYSCDSIGKKYVQIWVTDLAGNQSFTTTFITVQDNNNICGPSSKIKIGGNIFTEEKVSIPNTKVMIDGGETEGLFMTNDSGEFIFENLAMYNDYQINPIKNENPFEGISTLDIVMIQRHILGVQALDSPYKMIAADANNSKSITASDLVELRKIVLGVQDKFSNNNSWRFVDANEVFSDANHPWPFREILSYENADANMNQSDFIAVKIGDVNGTISSNYSPVANNRNKANMTLFTNDISLKENEITSIPIRMDHSEKLIAMQWTFELGKSINYLGIEPIGLQVKDFNFAEVVVDGKTYITVAYDDMDGFNISKEEIMFNLILSAKKSENLSNAISMSSKITKSQAYDIDDIELDINFEYRSTSGNEESSISQNHPNPFKAETLINIALKDGSTINIAIYDASGASVHNNTTYFDAGNHTISINEKQLGNKYGIFYCKIKSKTINQIIKILRIE